MIGVCFLMNVVFLHTLEIGFLSRQEQLVLHRLGQEEEKVHSLALVQKLEEDHNQEEDLQDIHSLAEVQAQPQMVEQSLTWVPLL